MSVLRGYLGPRQEPMLFEANLLGWSLESPIGLEAYETFSNEPISPKESLRD